MSKANIKTESFKIVINEIHRMSERQDEKDLRLIKKIADLIARHHGNKIKINHNKLKNESRANTFKKT